MKYKSKLYSISIPNETLSVILALLYSSGGPCNTLLVMLHIKSGLATQHHIPNFHGRPCNIAKLLLQTSKRALKDNKIYLHLYERPCNTAKLFQLNQNGPCDKKKSYFLFVIIDLFLKSNMSIIHQKR